MVLPDDAGIGQGSAEFGVGGFRTHPVVVVAGRQEQLSGDVGPNAEGLDERRRRGLGELLQQPAVDLDLLVELQSPTRQRAKDVAHASGRAGEVLRSKGGAGDDELVVSEVLELGPQVVSGSHKSRLEGDHGCRVGFHGRVAGDL